MDLLQASVIPRRFFKDHKHLMACRCVQVGVPQVRCRPQTLRPWVGATKRSDTRGQPPCQGLQRRFQVFAEDETQPSQGCGNSWIVLHAHLCMLITSECLNCLDAYMLQACIEFIEQAS